MQDPAVTAARLRKLEAAVAALEAALAREHQRASLFAHRAASLERALRVSYRMTLTPRPRERAEGGGL